ncbi:hypothetical protein K493DRAFT_311174 [Basidiobolus meristosporus CBS 931.73]|uniref:Myb/SANT-like DNA-binding domain-containing protein n=1 Tax=Basidiobolus meristosporus CBS 931.73 TaxID=1314790 RepID=A0A1Y1Z3R7_9FUNG|nr:hypothetical protein K493DRAFT_311174 [Basidiobolus meristosporus CBS 931.73]|eukprot:ORY04918.1 hypothetical protein K493DRAFT_311174 [Basidiobolus meristosporus CBS 931.73]
MIELYEERENNATDRRTDIELWKDGSKTLREKGFDRKASQCISKWRRFRPTYERAKGTGTEIKYPSENKLDLLVAPRKPNGRSGSRESSVRDPSQQRLDLQRKQPLRTKDCQGSLVSPATSDLSHKLVELLRSQLEFQNQIYTNIVEELRKIRGEEHQLRSEFLSVLKELDSQSLASGSQNATHMATNGYHDGPTARTSVDTPSNDPDHSSDHGIDVFEVDENLRNLRDHLSAPITQKPPQSR